MNEYADLSRMSSHLMLQGDSRKALGRYEECALYYRQAGELRRSMGEIKHQCGDFESAAEDWLSASACFVEAGDTQTANELVSKVRELKLPASRTDLVSAIHELYVSPIITVCSGTSDLNRLFDTVFEGEPQDMPTADDCELIINAVSEQIKNWPDEPIIVSNGRCPDSWKS